jgi:hypothetical protein
VTPSGNLPSSPLHPPLTPRTNSQLTAVTAGIPSHAVTPPATQHANTNLSSEGVRVVSPVSVSPTSNRTFVSSGLGVVSYCTPDYNYQPPVTPVVTPGVTSGVTPGVTPDPQNLHVSSSLARLSTVAPVSLLELSSPGVLDGDWSAAVEGNSPYRTDTNNHTNIVSTSSQEQNPDVVSHLHEHNSSIVNSSTLHERNPSVVSSSTSHKHNPSVNNSHEHYPVLLTIYMRVTPVLSAVILTALPLPLPHSRPPRLTAL